MPNYLTETVKIEILMMIGYGDRMRTQSEVVRLFRESHPDLPPINQGTISKIEAQYRGMGHVRKVPRKRQAVVDDDTKLNLLLALEENPVTPARQLARDSNLNHKTVIKILKYEKKRPYKMQAVQELLEDDPDRRLEFCDLLMTRIDQSHLSLDWILFSDEATFTLNGHVNRQNCRYWAAENPHWMRELHTQRPQKTNVWAGIIRDRIVGPFFFDDTINGARYLHFLQHELMPVICHLFPNPLNPNLTDERLWFQQDGAPPHYAAIVRQYLDRIFPGRWIGRRGTIEWPARSPDLTPLDFFLWGHLKSKVYIQKPNNIADLQERIREEINKITPEMLGNVRDETYHRLGCCQQVNGAHFEHLLH